MSYVQQRVHFIWSTKDRKKMIRESIQSDLYAYIGGILRKRKHVLLAAGGIEDHIHLLVGLHQSQAIADCVRDVKSNSTCWIHDNFADLQHFSWQAKYGAFSVSHSSVETVHAYIAKQKKHHKTMTYRDEFLLLLKKNNIEYDERFVLE